MPTIGLAMDATQLDRVDWSFHLGGQLRGGWDWELGPPPLRELEPARRTKSGRLSRNVPVQAWCMTTSGVLFLESGLEHELVTWLDRRPEVVWLVAQPAKLTWPDTQGHYPDLVSLDAQGQVTVWDARAEERRDRDFVEVSKRTARACAAVGWGYELFGGLDMVTSLNLRWVAGARRRPPWLESSRVVLSSLMASGRCTVQDVLDADEGRGHLVASLWHLVWTGEVVMDLSVPWNNETVLTIAEAVA